MAECQQMIDACRKAGRKLMIAYRSQYEPLDRALVRALVKIVQDEKLGKLKEFVSVNSQNMGFRPLSGQALISSLAVTPSVLPLAHRPSGTMAGHALASLAAI